MNGWNSWLLFSRRDFCGRHRPVTVLSSANFVDVLWKGRDPYLYTAGLCLRLRRASLWSSWSQLPSLLHLRFKVFKAVNSSSGSLSHSPVSLLPHFFPPFSFPILTQLSRESFQTRFADVYSHSELKPNLYTLLQRTRQTVKWKQ